MGTLVLLIVFFTTPTMALARDKPGVFDYYTLTLSWSPTFCRSPAGRNAQAQCAGPRKFAFVVHGLWPQFFRGWPQYCRQKAPYLPNKLINSLLDIIPSKRLIIHEWKKHGTCVGINAQAYFSLARDLFGQIKIPARYLNPSSTLLTTPQQLRTDFLKTNHLLKENMISVQCGNSTRRARLKEVRICFNRRGQLAKCGRNESRQCRARQLILPPVR